MSREVKLLPMEEGVTYEVKGNGKTSPPGGWSYYEPRTGRWWDEISVIDDLVRELAGHRSVNGIEVGDPWGDVIDYTARRLLEQGNADWVTRTAHVERGFLEYWQGKDMLIFVAAKVARGEPVFVDDATARTRAEICVDCPKNVKPSNPSLLRQMVDWQLRGMVGGRTTGLEDQLLTCQVCSCLNRVTVHMVLDFFPPSAIKSRDYPAHCWKVKRI